MGVQVQVKSGAKGQEPNNPAWVYTMGLHEWLSPGEYLGREGVVEGCGKGAQCFDPGLFRTLNYGRLYMAYIILLFDRPFKIGMEEFVTGPFLFLCV